MSSISDIFTFIVFVSPPQFSINSKVFLGGTVRTFKEKTRILIQNKLNDTAKGIAQANGGDIEFIYKPGYPPTINTKDESIFASEVAKKLVDEDVKDESGNLLKNPDGSQEPLLDMIMSKTFCLIRF